ncbi:sel1 repeat family protein [Vibrio sp. S9_S30]|uniref:sel1 repeat family protein n=1 Tax=Vibrio sp. S9_S30 TaxID=2720226 RepID=UPI001680B1D7|nr:sel1 repeat family protein [Vibrio sp. S9_S30]MBD1559953.1 sel1 repeat family protein [Vibrio sp. S9_S30]
MKKIIFSTLASLVLFTIILFTYKTADDKGEELRLILNNIYSEDSEVRRNSITSLKKISDNGNSIAQYRYSEVLLRMNKQEEAIKYLQMSSEQGEMISTELLGLLLLENEKDKYQGFKLLVENAENGFSTSQLYLGICFQTGECGFSKNDYLSYHWLTSANDNGEESASFHLDGSEKQKLEESTYSEETKKILCELDSGKC